MSKPISPPPQNENNFEFTIGKWHCVMVEDELEINGVGYDERDQADDPTYDFVRELWRHNTGQKNK